MLDQLPALQIIPLVFRDCAVQVQWAIFSHEERLHGQAQEFIFKSPNKLELLLTTR